MLQAKSKVVVMVSSSHFQLSLYKTVKLLNKRICAAWIPAYSHAVIEADVLLSHHVSNYT